MTNDIHVHHGIDYVEFGVINMTESKRFYEEAFDWRFNDYGPAYAGIRKLGGEAGGFRLEPEVSPGGPLVILYSKDLDSTLAPGVYDRAGRDAQARRMGHPAGCPASGQAESSWVRLERCLTKVVTGRRAELHRR